ncbi:hypothetical protein K7432_013644 [Basidiobolus ranarum]|uniref:TOG domain-containing protein n=1 Tax=Basidiobolus ranarum TaxID=34480 RepID=A0ABR2VQJ9_9FUNG
MTDNDFSSLSLEEKLTHKNWKARLQAFEELTELYKTTELGLEFDKYCGHFKNFISDSNIAAQEAALVAVTAYVENAPNANKTREVVVPVIVEKCLGSTRAGTKMKAVELLLLYIEVDIPDPVIVDVIIGLNSKVPKIVAATVFTLKEIIHVYGTMMINVKLILKILPKIFGHSDKNVRAEGALLTIELYRWLGPALNSALLDLKPVQIKELKEAFEKLPAGIPVTERRLRCQQAAAATIDDSISEEDNDNVECVVHANLDLYDLAEPVDALKKISPTFFTELASTKWKERKEALEILLSVVKTPKLSDDNYSELIATLTKRIGDPNVMVGMTAVSCLEAIALGLRKRFRPYKSVVIPPVLEKLKEKKSTVVDGLRSCLDAVFIAINISDIFEEVTAILNHKNPLVKAETHRWITRCLKVITSTPDKGEVKWMSELFLKGLDDGDTNVRDTAAEGLGTLMKVVGEKSLTPLVGKLDKIKEIRVREYFEKAEVQVVQIVPKKYIVTKQNPISAPAKSAKRAPPNGKVLGSNDTLKTTPFSPLAPNQTKKFPSIENKSKSILTKPISIKTPLKITTSKPVTKNGAASIDMTKINEPIKFKFSNEDFEAHVLDVIPASILEDILSSNWKSRLTAMELLRIQLESNVENVEPELIVRQLIRKPGFKEVNFQVATHMYGIFQLLCEKVPAFSKGCAVLIVPGMAEKLGDAKLKKPTGECFSSIGEKYSLQFVLHHSYESWKKAKSPKILSDSLSWVREIILEFGIVGLDIRELVEFLKHALGSSNAAVRNNTVTVFGCLHMYIGPDIRSFVKELSPSQLSSIDAEFSRVEGQSPPEPLKGLTLLKAASTIPSGKDRATKSVDILDDLFPRVDISSQINTKLLKQLEDGNGKVRKECLEGFQKILEAANKRIKQYVLDLPGALKGRLADSNKNLMIMTLETLSIMAIAMGHPFEKSCRIVLPSVLGCLSDNKAHVRVAAISALDSFYLAGMLWLMIPVIAGILLPDSQVLRKDLLKWLSDKLAILESDGGEIPDLSPLVRSMFHCLQDRSAEIRKDALNVLAFLIKNIGYTSIRAQCSTTLNGSSLQTVLGFIDGLKPLDTLPVNSPADEEKSLVVDKKIDSKRESSAINLIYKSKPSPLGPLDLKRGNGPSVISKKRVFPIPTQSPNRNSMGEEAFASNLSLKPRIIPNKRNTIIASPIQSKTPSLNSDSGLPILTSDPRTKNARAEKDKGQSKWAFDTVRQDLTDLLAEQMRPHFNPNVHKLLFSTEHYRDREILSGLTILDDCIVNRCYAQDRFGIDSKNLAERYIANADMILKYLTLRFHDTNTSLTLKTLELLEHLIDLFDENRYRLSEYEASAFLPQFIHKLGEPKDVLRNQLRSILKQIYHLFNPNKIVTYILEYGLKSKNARTRAECLDELGSVIKSRGVNTIPIKSFSIIASHIGDRDAQVRNNALNVIVQAFLQIGDTIYKYTGKLSDKEKIMLDEKLKRSKPVTTLAKPLPKHQEHPTTPLSKLALPRAGTSLGHFEKSPRSLARPMSALPKPTSVLSRSSSSLAKASLFSRPPSSLSTSSSSLSISPSSSPKIHRPKSFLPRPGNLGKDELTLGKKPLQSTQTPAHLEFQPLKVVSPVAPLEHISPTSVGLVSLKVEKHRVAMFASKITTANASEIMMLMKSVDDLLKDNYIALLPNINNIVSAMTLKIYILFEDAELDSQVWCRQIKHMLLILTKIVMKKAVAYSLRVDVLEGIIEEVLKLLLLEDLPEKEIASSTPLMNKTLNTLLTMIIDHIDQNALYEALFNLYERTLFKNVFGNLLDP